MYHESPNNLPNATSLLFILQKYMEDGGLFEQDESSFSKSSVHSSKLLVL